MNDALKLFVKLKEVMGAYSGGAVSWKDFLFFEKPHPQDIVMYHRKTINGEKVIIMIVKSYGVSSKANTTQTDVTEY